jgi:hypothetical protein
MGEGAKGVREERDKKDGERGEMRLSRAESWCSCPLGSTGADTKISSLTTYHGADVH